MFGFRALTILAMDENKMIARALGDYLRRPGHDVTTVTSVSEVEDAVRKQHFDLLVLDGSVSHEPTTDLCRLIRERGFTGAIIIESGYDGLDCIQSFVDAGADDYIVKPFGPDDLLARLQLTLAARDRVKDHDQQRAAGPESARRITLQADQIVRDLRPDEEPKSETRSIGDNKPPSDLPLTTKQADDILDVLRDVRGRLDGSPATTKNNTEGKLIDAINILGGWIGKKLDVAADEAAKTTGKLAPAMIFAYVTNLQELLAQLLAHLRVLLGQ